MSNAAALKVGLAAQIARGCEHAFHMVHFIMLRAEENKKSDKSHKARK